MMRYLLLSMAVVFSPQPDAAGQSLSSAERGRLVDYLTTSQELLEEAVRDLSPEQWSYKPALDRWSVAECVEHLALAEQTIFGVVHRALDAPPVKPVDPKTVRERDQIILRLATDRSEKFSAPEQLKPTSVPVEESMRTFRQRRGSTLEFARSSHRDLRGHAADHPLFKNADTYQWLLLAAAHVERHVNQIRELKAVPGFPR
jgi:uncharacterized damage-inducible protein DinB